MKRSVPKRLIGFTLLWVLCTPSSHGGEGSDGPVFVMPRILRGQISTEASGSQLTTVQRVFGSHKRRDLAGLNGLFAAVVQQERDSQLLGKATARAVDESLSASKIFPVSDSLMVLNIVRNQEQPLKLSQPSHEITERLDLVTGAAQQEFLMPPIAQFSSTEQLESPITKTDQQARVEVLNVPESQNPPKSDELCGQPASIVTEELSAPLAHEKASEALLVTKPLERSSEELTLKSTDLQNLNDSLNASGSAETLSGKLTSRKETESLSGSPAAAKAEPSLKCVPEQSTEELIDSKILPVDRGLKAEPELSMPLGTSAISGELLTVQNSKTSTLDLQALKVEDKGIASWNEWFERFGKMGDKKLLERLGRYDNPAGRNTVIITVFRDHRLSVQLGSWAGNEFDKATLEAYEELNGNPLLEFPYGSKTKKISFEIDNHHETDGEVTEVHGRRIEDFKEEK